LIQNPSSSFNKREKALLILSINMMSYYLLNCSQRKLMGRLLLDTHSARHFRRTLRKNFEIGADSHLLI
jgi:hypothetical protein